MKNFDYAVRAKFIHPLVRTPFRPDRCFSADKPKQCPRCKSVLIAELLYGEPGRSAEVFAGLKAGRIVPAGRIKDAEGTHPLWKCLDCQTEIYLKES